MEEDGGEGATEGCGSTLKAFGMVGRAGLRGVRDGGGWDGLGGGEDLGITSSRAAEAESHHVGKGRTDGINTFAKCGDV